QLGAAADLPALTASAARLLEAARLLGVPLDLWQAQNHLLDAYRRLQDSGALNGAIHAAFLRLADRLAISRQMPGGGPGGRASRSKPEAQARARRPPSLALRAFIGSATVNRSGRRASSEPGEASNDGPVEAARRVLRHRAGLLRGDGPLLRGV